MALISRETYESLHGLLIHKLQSLLHIEQQVHRAIPKIAARSYDTGLRSLLHAHAEKSTQHCERIHDALTSLGESAKSITSEGVRGIIADADWILAHTKRKDAIDSTILGSMRIIAQYEIIGYATAFQWAQLMDRNRVCTLMKETLAEERALDSSLAALSETIFVRARTGMPAHIA